MKNTEEWERQLTSLFMRADWTLEKTIEFIRHTREEAKKEERERIHILVDRFDDSSDDKAGFELHMSNPVEFRNLAFSLEDTPSK